MNELEQLKLQLETIKAKKMLIVKSSNHFQAEHLKTEEKTILQRIQNFRAKESKEA